MSRKLLLQDVIVIIPGIMGSVLAKEGREIWGLSTASIWDNLWSLGDNLNRLKLSDGIGDSAPNDGIVATRLMPGLHLLPHFWKIDGYGDLIASVERRFELFRPTETQAGNLIEFPYDWRASNVISAQRLERRVVPELERWRRHTKNPDAKLVLICHSMGGLIARWFLEVLGGREVTRRLITIGTPYQGSINALEMLVNGFQLGRFGPNFDDLVRSFPSVYQLLPTYECLNNGAGQLQALGSVSLPNLGDHDIREGLTFHTRLQAAVNLDSKYTTHVIKGVVQPTSQSAMLRNGRIEPIREINGLDRGGDGTVPRPSAHPPEWRDDSQSIFYAQHHAFLQRTDSVLSQLGSVLAGRLGGWMSGVAQLGLDTPDVIEAGEVLRINVFSASGDATLRLHANVFAEDGEHEAGPLLMKTAGDGRYSEQFEGMKPGACRVQIGSAVQQKPVETVSDWTLVWDENQTAL